MLDIPKKYTWKSATREFQKPAFICILLKWINKQIRITHIDTP